MTGLVMVTRGGGCGGGGKRTRAARAAEEEEEQQNQLSLVALLLAALRKSMVACKVDRPNEVISTVHNMEIGWPTNVRHITHVTFDRFNGFLGLPVEFEVEIPGRVPSARYNLFLLTFFVLKKTHLFYFLVFAWEFGWFNLLDLKWVLKKFDLFLVGRAFGVDGYVCFCL